jgi:hypothetical protein
MRRAGGWLLIVLSLGCAQGETGALPADARVNGAADAAASIDAPNVSREPDGSPGRPDAGPPPDAPPPHIDAGWPDASPPDASPPDAPPGTPDAAPPPDAPPSPPDATPCTDQWIPILTNGTFDSGGGWTETSDGGFVVIGAPPTGVTAHSGANVAWMGGYTGGADRLTQVVSVPADSLGLRLNGYRIIGTQETDPVAYDFVYFRLLPAGGGTVDMGSFSNLDANTDWLFFERMAPAAYPGETLTVEIEMTNDAFYSTGVLLDTMALDVHVCR